MTLSTGNNRTAWWLLGFGLCVASWFAYFPLPFFEFYKEWLFAVVTALAALVLRLQPAPALAPVGLGRHPLFLAGGAVLAMLLLQAALRDGMWSRATIVACYVGFFLVTLDAGRRMYAARGGQSLEWVAWAVLIAALGNCLFAALQLNWIEFTIPLVAPRSGDRLSANLAQANHFADLLWLGCMAAIYLHVRGKLRLGLFVATALLLLFFSQLTGSRMVWLYVAFAAVLGGTLLICSRDLPVRRFSSGLVTIAALSVVVTLVLSISPVHDWFVITSGTQRMTSDSGENSTRLRLWLWQVGLDAARHAPMWGVGVGRYVGHGHVLSMSTADSPPAGADAYAHNLFIHLAAELGIPVALIVLLCVTVWLVAALRRAARDADTLAAVALWGVIFVHANLEYPLSYLYFLGLFGLFAGHVLVFCAPGSTRPNRFHWLGAAVPVAVLAIAGVAYAQFARLERAMQRVVMQVGLGAPPQRDATLESSLASLPSWSPYREYAEGILLMTALPGKDNAAELAARCDQAVTWGPSPYLLARCATVYQVAGQTERASYFANSLCKMFPAHDVTLVQSMLYVERFSPEADGIVSTCVERND